MKAWIVAALAFLLLASTGFGQGVLDSLSTANRKAVEAAAKMFVKDSDGVYWDTQVERKREELRSKVAKAPQPSPSLVAERAIYEDGTAPLWFNFAGKDDSKLDKGYALRSDVDIDGARWESPKGLYLRVEVIEFVKGGLIVAPLNLSPQDIRAINSGSPSSNPTWVATEERYFLSGATAKTTGERLPLTWAVEKSEPFAWKDKRLRSFMATEKPSPKERVTAVTPEELAVALKSGKAELSRWGYSVKEGKTVWKRTPIPILFKP